MITSLSRKRRLETIIYIGLWGLVVTLYLLVVMRARSYTSEPLLDVTVIVHAALNLTPFLALFWIHNSVLVQRLLFRNRYAYYLLFTIVLVFVVWGCQYLQFFHEISHRQVHPRPDMLMRPRHMLPLPLFLDLIYDMLIIGVNLAVALIFQRFEDRLERESLQKANAENQLAYLKAQINPHFYMNMLNNIHGMIDVNPEKAQEMLIDMSHLMRYMLYESSMARIALSEEIGFLKNYISLMRQRYPDDLVKISAEFPTAEALAGVMVPPLLFLIFIENSFKHGISYRDESFVSVNVEVQKGKVEFRCLNSVHDRGSSENSKGIGLRNVAQRLKLIYGDRCNMEIKTSPTTYLVNLTIPANED